MKKESNKATGSVLLKFIAMLMLIVSAILVHFEYIINRTKAAPEAHVMKVHIETGDKTKVEEDAKEDVEEKAADLAIENNEISAIISEDFKIQSSVQDKIEQYRIYLLHVMHLSSKFLQHEDYDSEVEFLLQAKDNYPNDVAKLLKSMKDYRDEYLTLKDEEYNKLDLEGSFTNRIINKIVNIEKKNPQYQIREVEYTNLKSKLYDMMMYFYSKEFLKKYLGND